MNSLRVTEGRFNQVSKVSDCQSNHVEFIEKLEADFFLWHLLTCTRRNVEKENMIASSYKS